MGVRDWVMKQISWVEKKLLTSSLKGLSYEIDFDNVDEN
jgi:hypothetical protein